MTPAKRWALVIAAIALILAIWTRSKRRQSAITTPDTRPRGVPASAPKPEAETEAEAEPEQELASTKSGEEWLAEGMALLRAGKGQDELAGRAFTAFLASSSSSSNAFIPPSPSSVAEAHLAMARFHHHGLPGRLPGLLSKEGRAPDGHAAIHNYLRALEIGGFEIALFEIAVIYMHGLHPTHPPDKKVARNLYRAILQHAADRLSRAGKALARRRLREAERAIAPGAPPDPDAIPARGATALPKGIVREVRRILDSDGAASTSLVPMRTMQNNAAEASFTAEAYDEDDYEDDGEDPEENDDDDGGHYSRTRPVELEATDSQNVHDDAVQRAVNAKLETFSREQTKPTNEGGKEAVKSFLSELSGLSGLSLDNASGDDADDEAKRLERITKVCDSLTSAPHPRFGGRSELQVFAATWARINHPVNRGRRRQLVTALAQELDGAVEHGEVVCSSGKISHMLAALDVLDVGGEEHGGILPILRPEWAIDQEIASVAARVRDAYLGQLSPASLAAYESPQPNPAQQEVSRAVTERMAARLREKCAADYVSTGVLSPSELEAKLLPYIEAM